MIGVDIGVPAVAGLRGRIRFPAGLAALPGRLFWRIPLQAKLVVPLLALICGSTALLAHVELAGVDATTTGAYAKLAAGKAGLVQDQLRRQPGDATALQALLNQVAAASPAVRSIAVYQLDSGGPSLRASAGASPGVFVPAEGLTPDGRGGFVESIALPGPPASELVLQLSGQLGRQLGSDVMRSLLIVSLLEIAALLVSFRLWSRWLVDRRIVRLTSAAAGMADGKLDVEVREAGRVREGDELSRLGAQLGRMVTTSRLRADRQAALDLLTEDAAKGLGLAGLYARAAKLLAEGMTADVTALYELFTPSGILIRRAATGDRFPSAQLPVMGPSQFHSRVLATGEVLQGDADAARQLGLGPAIRHLAAVQIQGRSQSGGMLLVGSSSEKGFSNDRLEFLRSVGHIVAAAVSALHDPLTGLPNRALFEDRLTQALNEGRRTDEAVCLYYIDLDNFKEVNDSLGHQAGDELLRHVSERLRKVLRASDLLARLGGDEFALVQTLVPQRGRAEAAEAGAGPDGQAVANQTARRLLNVLAPPFRVEGAQLFVGASIGIAIYPEHGLSPSVLSRNADRAMYEAKLDEKGSFRVFTDSMHSAALRRLTIDSGLRAALRSDELKLHFQPQVDVARPGRVVGFEALLRWPSSGDPAVPPNVFVPIAEQTGLIVPLGLWALRQACLQAAEWTRRGFPPVRMAVNVAAAQFGRPDFVESVRRVLEETGLDPQLLELEVTEGSVMRGVEEVTGRLRQLRDLGVTIAVDDFGTGYSSLAYLNRLPFDALKVDRSFVRRLTEDTEDDDGILVRAIVQLGRSLNKTVIAEGIETAEQLSHLQRLGCDLGQGFLFAHAVSADAAADLLASAGALSPPPAAGSE